MARWVYMLVAFTALSAWAGAQNPAQPSLSAEDKLRLLRANRTLVDNLVNDAVKLSAASDPATRAERCRDASVSLANAIKDAAAAENAERVAELTGLFGEVVRDGLVPTLDAAQQTVTPESPSGRKLREVRAAAAVDLINLKAAIPASGKVGDNPRVKDALQQLDLIAPSLKLP